MYDISLQWKEFNVSLKDVCDQVAILASVPKVEACANYNLVLHLPSEPTPEVKAAIQSYWDGLTTQSVEATGYKSKDDIKSEKQNKKQSAKSKLLGLGLTEEEIEALVGV